MNLQYILKAQSGDTARHLVFVGRWKLGELMIRPGRATFHGTHKAGVVAQEYPSREAFEADLETGV